jgi:hypothetical protein
MPALSVVGQGDHGWTVLQRKWQRSEAWCGDSQAEHKEAKVAELSHDARVTTKSLLGVP